MNEFETLGLIVLALVVLAGFINYKIKQANQRIEALFRDQDKEKNV